ncbi:MAG: hypothetical protein HOP19_00620 [Acidobacteria bacterium]|nr:hypothetical protein [Acidobacteriota bacterium]
MSNQKETKLNPLTINKETIQDLDAPNASDIVGGATINQNQTEQIRCQVADQTVAGYKCNSEVRCPIQQP